MADRSASGHGAGEDEDIRGERASRLVRPLLARRAGLAAPQREDPRGGAPEPAGHHRELRRMAGGAARSCACRCGCSSTTTSGSVRRRAGRRRARATPSRATSWRRPRDARAARRGRPRRRRHRVRARVQGRRHRRLAVGGDGAAEPEGAGSAARGIRLGAGGLGPARRALAHRPAPQPARVGEAARMQAVQQGSRRRSRTTISASGS